MREVDPAAAAPGPARPTGRGRAVDDDAEIVAEFLVESHENLDQLDRDLVELERTPDSRELLSSIFRTIHTIKGTSGFLAFNRLEALTHVGENLLSRLRDGKMVMTTHTAGALLTMVDTDASPARFRGTAPMRLTTRWGREARGVTL